MQSGTDNAVEKRLANFVVAREGEGVLAELPVVDLVDRGFLDSLDFVTLAVFIRREFGVELDVTDEATGRAMHRFGSLVELVVRARS